MIASNPVASTARLLAASAVAVSVTGTVNETTLATVTIPGGAMGLNGGVEVRTVWSVTNSANNKSLRVRHGGIAGTQHAGITVTAASSIVDVRKFRNRGSASSQVGGMNSAAAFGSSAAAVITSAIDTTVSQDVVITGQLALATETIALESYEVWLLP